MRALWQQPRHAGVYRGRKYFPLGRVAGGLNTTQRLELQSRLKDGWFDVGGDRKGWRKLPFLKE